MLFGLFGRDIRTRETQTRGLRLKQFRQGVEVVRFRFIEQPIFATNCHLHIDTLNQRFMFHIRVFRVASP